MMSEIRSKVITTVEEMKDEIIRFLQDLIRIPTENPPGRDFIKCACFLEDKLKQIGFQVNRIEVPEEKLKELDLTLPRVIPLARWEGTTGKPVLHANGHYDVKPADWQLTPGTKWTVNPFGGKIRDGKIFGRGTTDMKGGIVAMIFAAEALKKTGVKLHGTLEFAPVPDEEIGGLGGSKFLVEEGYVKPDMVFVAEPGGPITITHGARGMLTLKVNTFGVQPSHFQVYSGVEGINAIDKMANVIIGLRDLKLDINKRTSKYDFPLGSGRARLEITNIEIIGDESRSTQVPEICSITISRRLIPEEKHEDAIKEIENVLQKLKKDDDDLKYELKTINSISGWIQPKESKIIQTVAKNIREVTKKEPKFVLTPGASDLRFFVDRFNIPAFWYGPGVRGTQHGADEYVTISNLIECTKVLALTYMDLLGFDV